MSSKLSYLFFGLIVLVIIVVFAFSAVSGQGWKTIINSSFLKISSNDYKLSGTFSKNNTKSTFVNISLEAYNTEITTLLSSPAKFIIYPLSNNDCEYLRNIIKLSPSVTSVDECRKSANSNNPELPASSTNTP